MAVQEIPKFCQCGNPMVDNRANKRSEKSPDFKCKNAAAGKDKPGCQVKPVWLKDGNVWADQQGGAPTQTSAAPQPSAQWHNKSDNEGNGPITAKPRSAVPVDKDVGDYYAILTAVLVHHAAFTKEAPLAGPQAEDIANTATFSDLRTIATTISIARNGGRG